MLINKAHLQQQRDRCLETYREILEFGKEKAGDELSTYFKIKSADPIYYRRYRITVMGLPVILIIEKFFEDHFRVASSSRTRILPDV